jgi:hypothetical protein
MGERKQTEQGRYPKNSVLKFVRKNRSFEVTRMPIKSLIEKAFPAIFAGLLVLSGCSKQGPESTPIMSPTTLVNNPTSINTKIGVSSSDRNIYKPTWVTPSLQGESISIPLSAIQQNKMIHFWIILPIGREAYMAYSLDGTTYVRAAICVPCGSIGFSLQKGILNCDTCGTEFDAKTGKGISGGCINYPKSAAKIEVTESYIISTVGDLWWAYDETVMPE